LVEVIEHRVMAVVAVVEGAIAREARGAMEAKAKAAMAKAAMAKGAMAKAAMEAQAKTAMEVKAKAAKANASVEGHPCQDRPVSRSLSIDASIACP
jgi:hypothetical protein